LRLFLLRVHNSPISPVSDLLNGSRPASVRSSATVVWADSVKLG
jgi:hypothetical protein